MNIPGKIHSAREQSKTDTIAGIVVVIAMGIATIGAIVLSHGHIASQYASPALSSFHWGVSWGLVATTAFILTIFAYVLLIGWIRSVATPMIDDYTEYALGGIGGFVGLVIALAYLASNTALLSSQTDAAAAATITVPIAGLLYSMVGSMPERNRAAPLTPEEAQERATIIREDSDRPRHRTPTTSNKQQDSTDQSQQQDAANQEQDEQMEEPSQGLDYTGLSYDWRNTDEITFDDVGGLEAVKEELETDVILPLTEQRDKAKELGITVPNIIFHGPPGTGKTYVAEAMAGELGLPFVKLSGADIQSKWLNESAEQVKDLFDEATTVADHEGGAVVFLDEIDAVLKDRNASMNTHEEDLKVVNEFLNHLEDTGEHNIVFVGATNRYDALDDAGVRSGRIDKKIEIHEPNGEARLKILKTQLADRPHNLNHEDIESMACRMDGAVAADIELLVENAAKETLKRGGDGITIEDLTAAHDRLDY